MTAQGWEQGQGLGKGGGGRTNFIRAKKKTDVLGLGAKQGEDDSWNAMTGLYNELLQRLSVEGGDHVHDNGGVSKVVEVEDTSKTLQDYIVKKRLYGRFRKAKDTCGYSQNDMAAILGKKTEPAVAKPDQLGYTRAVSAVATVEKKKEADDGSGVTTTTSKMSIRDYFSKKMSVGGSRYSAAGGAGFTEEFQENHYNQLHKVADTYHGKMGLGSGRSSDPWEDTRPTFSSSSFSSSSSSSSPSTLIETKATEVISEEKPKKSKKKREVSPPKIVTEEIIKPKKSKKDSSSSSSSLSSSSSASLPSSSSSLSLASSSLASDTRTKKSKKSKETAISISPQLQIEVEKPKKNKKAKTVEQPQPEVQEPKKVKKDKRLSKKDDEDVKKCSYCNSLDVPMTCGGCQKAFYCGILCQSSHWATHKLKCKLQC